MKLTFVPPMWELSQGVATHEVIIVADHLLGPHGDRVLAASAETLCDATGCLTNAYSVPPVYLPERLMGLVTDLRDHFANPAEVEDVHHCSIDMFLDRN